MLRRLGISDDPGHYVPNLQACLEVVLEQSDRVIDEVLNGLASAAQPAIGKKGGVEGEPAARRAIEQLNAQAGAFKKAFVAQLRKGVLGGFGAGQSEQSSMRFDDFQFLDAAQLDANIEAAQSLQTVQMVVGDALPPLNAMVSNLLGWSSVQAHLNPLRPDVYVHALLSVMKEFVSDRGARSTVVNLASGLLGVCLHDLYKATGEWLRSQGVEPVHMTATKATGLWNPTVAPDSTVARTMLTLDKLRRLLSGELDANPLAADQLDFSTTIPASLEALQDMKLVEPMMKRLSERASKAVQAMRNHPGVVARVPDMLSQSNDPVQRKNLGEQLSREVVLLMLDHLMKDRRLLPRVRASLQQLEPALLKLSQQDLRLFSERHHPARMFLDRVTHRSLAFANENAPGYAHFQKSFDNAVSVLCGGAGDATAFARSLRKLDDAWAQEDADQHRRASDAARGLLRAEQRNMLAQRLSHEFAERLQGAQVPEVAKSFLRGPWAQVVAEAQLKFADSSVDPGGYRALVDDLIWSVQLRLTRQNRGRLVHMMPEMLVTMRRGLDLISYPQERMTAFFDALVSIHEQVFDNPDTAELDEDTDTMPSAALGLQPLTLDQPWMVEQEAADSGYMDEEAVQRELQASASDKAAIMDRRSWRVESLSIGAWVDLALGGSWIRAQLTWASPQRTLFMFLSSGGMAHSMSRRTIDKMKKAGLLRMVSERRVMDNALDGVAQAALQNELRAVVPKER